MVALAVLRNEPKDVSRPIEGTTDEPQGSLRNEPTVISEAVAVGRGKGEVEDEVVRNERGAVRSVRFDGGLTGVVRGAQQLLQPGDWSAGRRSTRKSRWRGRRRVAT